MRLVLVLLEVPRKKKVRAASPTQLDYSYTQTKKECVLLFLFCLSSPGMPTAERGEFFISFFSMAKGDPPLKDKMSRERDWFWGFVHAQGVARQIEGVGYKMRTFRHSRPFATDARKNQLLEPLLSFYL